jgi:hypothetical protein
MGSVVANGGHLRRPYVPWSPRTLPSLLVPMRNGAMFAGSPEPGTRLLGPASRGAGIYRSFYSAGRHDLFCLDVL